MPQKILTASQQKLKFSFIGWKSENFCVEKGGKSTFWPVLNEIVVASRASQEFFIGIIFTCKMQFPSENFVVEASVFKNKTKILFQMSLTQIGIFRVVELTQNFSFWDSPTLNGTLPSVSYSLGPPFCLWAGLFDWISSPMTQCSLPSDGAVVPWLQVHHGRPSWTRNPGQYERMGSSGNLIYNSHVAMCHNMIM